ncbi:hypothetical protein C1H46_007070 [Malus baccata]|uniref:Uncharacterized protein n=1 Tax=Malus baccata TaxID=106549 RepID=A0A540N8Q0_MALBA|nr:hypothetical protein C1H46_007070 [Malus baccata]
MDRVSSGGEDEEAAGCRKCSSGPGLLLRMDLLNRTVMGPDLLQEKTMALVG